MLKLAVLISGGGSNLKALIDATEQPGFPARIVCVGADTEAPGLAHATAAGIPTFVVRPRDYGSREEWGQVLAAAIQEHGVGTGPEPGLVVSAGLMRILPGGFVREFSPNLINTHPALLPLYPGAHAVRDALAAGATETGVTVHIIDEGVDTGPVLRQARVEIAADEAEADLHERIKQLERPLLVETVREIASGELVLDAATI
ncbi:phosphoribosylglycinamide formyltransferase [Leucobacter salsicius]|uniref:phosphoribosylglycinamide formyltransferase n=1 Tax=Leucobacter salsicius TaxID=664638 RepID=UPI00034B6811|nr:phosphoribosylglycinamide formyltransferase [Leucobacter salsicius]